MKEVVLEKIIFQTVRSGHFTIRAVFEKLMEDNISIDESTVREVVWNLVDEGRLSFTLKGKLYIK
jgi:hypothetical protein